MQKERAQVDGVMRELSNAKASVLEAENKVRSTMVQLQGFEDMKRKAASKDSEVSIHQKR